MEDYIKLVKVSYTYPKGKFGLKEIDLVLKRGQITAICGENGSGKTTLGKVMMGICIPNSGEIYINGSDASALKLWQRGSKIGYVFQNPDRQLFAATVLDEIIFPLEIKGVDKQAALKIAQVLLERFKLTHLKEKVPMRLSRGEKQRLVVAAVLAQQPGYLILDEPSSGLDRDRKRELYQLLQELKNDGTGIAVISHDQQFINAQTDCVIKMKDGRIVENGG
ncbi:ABC transporter ATP-binding protein [Eubacteriaceae bacterium ES2]|nr:ABC transporter ATP-binding protein [Eubacteriaceae bacterium ES2]